MGAGQNVPKSKRTRILMTLIATNINQVFSIKISTFLDIYCHQTMLLKHLCSDATQQVGLFFFTHLAGSCNAV